MNFVIPFPPYGNGLVRSGGNVVVEFACLALAGRVGKADNTGAGLLIGAGFVETNLSLLAHADYQKVKVAGKLIVLDAVVGYLCCGNGAVRDVDVFREDVDVVDEGFVQNLVAALR